MQSEVWKCHPDYNKLCLHVVHFLFFCLAERGEGAAIQLALFDGRFTEHGLGLFYARHGHCTHSGDAPVRRQQGMTGRGQTRITWRLP